MQDALMLRKGPWLKDEDKLLIAVVTIFGERRWDMIARASGLKRSGKSCRLRWLNYLRPNLKRGPICHEEKIIIVQLHEQWGNKWSRIARKLPGRTDNEIKNYWRTHLRKKEHCEEQGAGQFEDSMIQRCDTNVTKFSYQCKSTIDCSDVVKGSPSNSEIENSTFESQNSDWLLGLSDDQCGFGQYERNLYINSSWKTENGETSLWDCSDCLWDFD